MSVSDSKGTDCKQEVDGFPVAVFKKLAVRSKALARTNTRVVQRIACVSERLLYI